MATQTTWTSILTKETSNVMQTIYLSNNCLRYGSLQDCFYESVIGPSKHVDHDSLSNTTLMVSVFCCSECV